MQHRLYAYLTGLLFVLTAIFTWFIGYYAAYTVRGQMLDEIGLLGARDEDGPLRDLIYPLLSAIGLPLVLIALAVALLWALARKRFHLAASMLLLTLGANLSTQFIKHFLVHRVTLVKGLEITPNSFPSGHTTIVASISTVFVLVAPAKARPWLAGFGAVWLTLTGMGTMISSWHRPSDVLGAIVVTACWSFLFLMLASWQRQRKNYTPQPVQVSPRYMAMTAEITLGLAFVIAGLIGILLLLPANISVTSPTEQHVAYVCSFLLVGGTSLAYLAGISMLRSAADGGNTRAGITPSF